jgi:hypothetical protein
MIALIYCFKVILRSTTTYHIFLENEPIYALHVIILGERGFRQVVNARLSDNKFSKLANEEDLTDTLKKLVFLFKNRFTNKNLRYSREVYFPEYQQKEITRIQSIANMSVDPRPAVTFRYDFIEFYKLYAFLFLYCVIQFRNFKANNFNIIYLTLGGFFLRKLGSPIFESSISDLLEILESNAPKGFVL